MVGKVDRATWRWRHDLEKDAQLKADLHDALGRLLTRCYERAQNDPSCADYWTGEAQYWQQQYTEAMKLMDAMIVMPTRTPAPAPGAQVHTQNITIHAGGDAIIADVHDSQAIAIGKELTQDVQHDG